MIELDDRVIRPGGRVSGVVRLGQPATAVEAVVTYAERSPSFEHVYLRLASGPLPAGSAEVPFAIELPPRLYPAAVTPWGSLSWQLAVRVEPAGEVSVETLEPEHPRYAVVRGGA